MAISSLVFFQIFGDLVSTRCKRPVRDPTQRPGKGTLELRFGQAWRHPWRIESSLPPTSAYTARQLCRRELLFIVFNQQDQFSLRCRRTGGKREFESVKMALEKEQHRLGHG